MSNANDVHIVTKPIKKAEILYQSLIFVENQRYREPISLNMRVFRVYFPKQELWMPFNEPHPFQVLRLCWKFPDREPMTEIYDLSGLNNKELVDFADDKFSAKAESLSGNQIADSIKNQLKEHHRRVLFLS